MQEHKRQRFDPWVRKIPSSRKWQPTPVFLPGKFHRQRSLGGWGTVHGVTKSQTRLSGLSTHRHTNLLPFKGFALPLTSPHLTTGGGVFRAGDHPSPFLVQWIISAYLCRTWTLLHWCQRHWVQKGPSLGPPDPRANTRTRWSNSLLGFHTIKYILLYFTFLHYELYCQLSENRKLC